MGSKYLVISDNHGNMRNMKNVIKKFGKGIDGLIHCGDLEFFPTDLEDMVDCPVYMACGNCDYVWDARPLEQVFDLGPHRALVTHGHRYDIRWDLTMLEDRAQELGVDVIFFGHSHRPAILQFPESGLTCYNPGSIALPRQFQPMGPTFMLLDVDDDGTLHPTHCYFGPRGKKFISFDLAPEVIQ